MSIRLSEEEMKGKPNLLNAYPAAGPSADNRDRFRQDSIPKELTKKVFGKETAQVRAPLARGALRRR